MMTLKISILMVFFFLLTCPGFAQEKSKKQLKEEQRAELKKQTEALVKSQVFVFKGRMAYPQGGRSVDLTTNTNYVKFSPDLIESYLPFFGKAYSGVGYGGDSGLKFEGKPEEFTIETGKKNYIIKAEVKGENDVFRLTLNVGFEGGASLTVISNNRSSISYSGDISAPEKATEKK
ncbi:MAG: DUF4251 domain-containing protein [Lentimicrobium sp.]